MTRAFTIEELRIASACLFPADLERLWEKHRIPGSMETSAALYAYRSMKSNTLMFMDEYVFPHKKDQEVLALVFDELLRPR